MAVTGISGIDIRANGGKLVFRATLYDTESVILTSGTTSLFIYELQDDGTLKSYDFDDNTFKTTVLTTPSVSMTHRTGNNSSTNTGIWTYVLSNVSGFTESGIYFAVITNLQAVPAQQSREFQFAGGVLADVTKTKGKSVVPAGTVTAGATSTSIPTTSFSPAGAAVDQFKGRTLYFDTDTLTASLRGVVCYVTASTNATNPTLTVEMADGGALPTTPASGDTFVLG